MSYFYEQKGLTLQGGNINRHDLIIYLLNGYGKQRKYNPGGVL